MNDQTCCFTGHRHLPINRIESILKRLNNEIDPLIIQGVTNFISGGVIGFDQTAASLIAAKKEMGYPIRLIFALLCRNQDEKRINEQKRLFHGLLSEANVIHYVSEKYSDDCMKNRNRYMVEQSAFCICVLLQECGVTSQTVNFAQRKGLRIINAAE